MDNQTLNTSSHATYRLFYHVVLTTTYRHKCMTAERLDRLEQILVDTCRKWRCRLVEFGGEADPVHLFIDAHPSMNLARMLGNLKTVSSRLIRKAFANHLESDYWKPFFWHKAYSVLTVGSRANLETLIKYIEDQEAPPSRPLD